MQSRKGTWILPVVLLSLVSPTLSFYFWQIGDFHWDPTYGERSESCNEEYETYGKLGHHGCDPPFSLIQSCVDALVRMSEELEENPTFILWGGDNAHHIKNSSDTMITKEYMARVILPNLTDTLTQAFPEIPIYPVLGNHDYWPKNNLPADAVADIIYDAMSHLWRDWITMEGLRDFRRAGYYAVQFGEDPPVKGLVLNTNLYLEKNEVTRGLDDPGNQLQWMDIQLSRAREGNYKVALLTHVPTGYQSRSFTRSFMREAQMTRYNQLIRDYSDVIIIATGAHEHYDTFRMFYDANGTAVSSMLIAPAVSPWRGGKSTAPDRNPSLRKVEFVLEDNNYRVTDIQNFYLDLDEANSQIEPRWRELYRFTDTYGAEDLTPQSLHDVLEKFKKDGSPEFEKYYRYTTSNADREGCDCECKVGHLCAIEFVDAAEYNTCLEARDHCSGATKISSTIAFVICLFVFLLNYFS